MSYMQEIEKAIREVAAKFQEHPFGFLHECDLQAELYSRLLSKFKGKPTIKFKGKPTISSPVEGNSKGRQVYTEMRIESKTQKKSDNRSIAADLVVVDGELCVPTLA